MNDPLWSRDPDAALKQQRSARDWIDLYGRGLGCLVLTGIEILILVGVIGGLTMLFR